MANAKTDDVNLGFRRPKSEWSPGPWQNEPDREEWRYKGVVCLAKRGPVGAWCGYVGVPPSHPWHGKDYGHDDLDAVEVHGGLTYANSCEGNPLICHVPQPGEPEHVWWLGFDCAHLYDLVPLSLGRLGRYSDMSEYRDLPYVKAEVEQLADQVIAASEV